MSITFESFGLNKALLQALTNEGYTIPTPIQAQAIPDVMLGKDLLGIAQTGTGKTAAFALPILHRLAENRVAPLPRTTRCLILSPTRELASQIAESFKTYGRHLGFKVAVVFGGVKYGPQERAIQGGLDVLVATPGRLLDHMQQKTLDLSSTEIFVLDEADQMLDLGFVKPIRQIVSRIPAKRQNLFFSATMPPAIQTFAQWCLTDPLSIEIARTSIPTSVTHAFYPVAMDQRDELLLELLKQTEYHSVMIFTRTRKEADQLTSLIKTTGQPKVAAMHSDINQVDRMKALAGFKAGEYEILVATDVAARGIDISNVSHVINYRVPENAEDYVHRIGRTGRAEAEGDAFTILTADELDYAKSVEIFIDQPIPRRKLEDFDYIYTALLDDSPIKAVRRKKMGGGKKRR